MLRRIEPGVGIKPYGGVMIAFSASHHGFGTAGDCNAVTRGAIIGVPPS